MKETKRTAKLFEDLYDGDPWIGVTIHETLKNITPEQAARKLQPQLNSIWQITNHIISWRENVLKRLKGEVITTPTNNYMASIFDTSETAWQQTIERMQQSHEQWIPFLKAFDKEDLEEKYKGNDMSYYEHIHGILQHDCYHLGQIVFLTKVI
ncbi:MAG: DinB family protein [Ferruginibacter sp.]